VKLGLQFLGSALPIALALGCTTYPQGPADAAAPFPVDGGPVPSDAVPSDAPALDAHVVRDGGPIDSPLGVDPDAECARATAEVEVSRLPVDVIWVIDSSSSMAPAIEQVRSGLNAFADRIFESGLDYRVIVLALRGTEAVTGRYPVCIPPPLAGAACADGERFFHVDVDVRSTQPIEQLLGTLAQSEGYLETDDVGSAPWRHLLREGSTKTIVVVTDDNARTCALPVGTCARGEPPLTDTSLEDFPGGANPFNSRMLGPGLRTTAYGDLFEDYTFDAIYGWGDERDREARCTFDDGSQPSSAGQTYTALVERTGGSRARICDGPSAWGPFFEAVASGVVRTSRIECELALPEPPDGSVLSPRRVNVEVRGASGSTLIPYSGDAGACDPERGGWHYDDPDAPTRVILCPSSCESARDDTAVEGGIDVIFGCDSVLI
jgi:hypothetical protein